MKKIIRSVFSFLALIGGYLGLTSCAGNMEANVVTNTDTMNTPPEKNDSIKSNYSSDDIRAMLDKLANTPVKADPKLGAMCYSKVAPRDTSAYVCPVCGEKTLYKPEEHAYLRLEIPQIRSMMKFFPASVKLDETAFCKHCRPSPANAPQLCLKVTLSDRPEHTTCGIYITDLEILLAFFKGETIRINSTGGEEFIKDDMPRIKSLLGIQ